MLRNNITRRKFLQGVAVTGLGVLGAQIMAACAAPAPGGTSDSAPAAQESSGAPAATDVVLRVQSAPAVDTIMPTKMGERLTAETGIQVVIEETIYNEIETKTQTGFISGTLQDLLYGHHRWLFINYLKGIYMEIDDMLASDPPEDYDDIYPSVMAGNSFDGKNFSFPSVSHPGGNIAVNFNVTMLEEKGLPLPQDGWTIADWTELAREAADPDAGIFGLGMDAMNALHYYSNVSRCFGPPDSTDCWVMNQEGTQITFNNEVHEEVVNWYADLTESRVAPRTADYIEESAGRIFVAGLNATHASTIGNAVTFISQIDGAFDIDTLLLPIGPEGRQGTCYSGNQHMMNSATEHPEEAWELLKLFSGIEAGLIMILEADKTGNGHKAVWTDPDVNAKNKMFGIADRLMEAGLEPFPMPRNTRFTEANNIFLNEIDLIWEGEVTFAEQAPIIEEKVQAVLDLDRPE